MGIKRHCAWALCFFFMSGFVCGQGCAGDDGLAGAPCCTPVTAPVLPSGLPSWPVSGSFSQDLLKCVVQGCSSVTSFTGQLTTSHIPVPGTRDYALVIVNIASDPAGPAFGWNGTLFAKYARTWLEPVAGSAVDRQVWRYLLNGDLTPGAGAPPAPMPPHAAGDDTHWFGHVDYACETTSTGQTWLMLLSLHHLNGCISHNALSARPYSPGLGFAHGNHSYHMVSPGSNYSCSAAANPPDNGFTGESARSTPLFPTSQVLGEGHLGTGSLSTASTTCTCVASTGSYERHNQTLSGTMTCGATVASFSSFGPLPAPLPPTGFVSFPAMSGTGQPGTFPGNRDIWVHWGVLYFQDPCASSTVGLWDPAWDLLHIFHGVTTTGHSGNSFDGTLTSSKWMDLEDSFLLFDSGLAGPYSLGWGAPFYSVFIWNICPN
jgi:hypothetical protein